MFEWFWNLPVMVSAQAVVDAGRAVTPGPTVTFPILMLAVFLVLRLLQAGTRRDGKPPGAYFLGNLTPRTMDRLSVNNRVRRPRSREEIRREIRRRKRGI